MKKFLFVAPLVLTVAGCGQTSNIESVIKDRLRDPESAKFKQVVVSKFGNFACAQWNAKNGMGGYGDWGIAELKKVGSEWVVTDMEGRVDECTPEGLKSKERYAVMMECTKDIANPSDDCLSKIEKLQ